MHAAKSHMITQDQLRVQLRTAQHSQLMERDSFSFSFLLHKNKQKKEVQRPSILQCPCPRVLLDCRKLWHEPHQSSNPMSNITQLSVLTETQADIIFHTGPNVLSSLLIPFSLHPLRFKPLFTTHENGG